MFSKSNLLSTVVCAIWAFFGGYLLWPVLAGDFMMNHAGTATGVNRAMPDYLFLTIGCVVIAFAFSTIYNQFGSGNYSAGDGAKLGLWIGILAGFGGGLINYSTSNLIDLTGALANGLIYIVYYVVLGALAGLVYNKTMSAA